MNIFNYESKFNQLLMTLADLIILNLLFVVCSLPIFTIGAAQAGLFTGIRVLRTTVLLQNPFFAGLPAVLERSPSSHVF